MIASDSVSVRVIRLIGSPPWLGDASPWRVDTVYAYTDAESRTGSGERQPSSSAGSTSYTSIPSGLHVGSGSPRSGPRPGTDRSPPGQFEIAHKRSISAKN